MGLHCLTKYLFRDYQSTSEQHLNCMQYNTTFKVRLYTFRVCTLEKYRLQMVHTKYGSTGPKVIKLFFLLNSPVNSTEHEISTAHKN